MRCMPALAAPFADLRLPMADAAAEILIQAIFERSADDRLRLLVRLLKTDPAFAIWSVLQAEAMDEMAASPTEMAQQLEGRIPACLVRNVDESHGNVFDESLLDQIVELTRDSLAAADRISKITDEKKSLNAERSHFTGLIHNASKWLSLTASSATALRKVRLPNLFDATPGTGGSESLAAFAQAARQWWSRQNPLAAYLTEMCQDLDLCDRLQAQFSEELEDQKLRAMYKLAAGAGHEINNPLGSIAGRAQLLLRDETNQERRRTLAKINTQAFRAHEMIADMMLFAKPPTPTKQQVNLVRLIEQVVEELCSTAADRQTQLVHQTTNPSVVVEADETQLLIVIQALCKNALEALGGGGHIEIGSRIVGDTSQPTGAEIIVRDDGPGVPTEHRPHLFDPFYSGREAGRGLGFGLSKCWRIVKNHGGNLTVESSPGHGATFTVSLPAA